MQHFDSQPAAPAVWLDALPYPDAPADLEDITDEYVLGTDGAEPCDAEAEVAITS